MGHRLGSRFAATLLLTAVSMGLHGSGCLVRADDADKRRDGAPGTGGNGDTGGDGGGGEIVPPLEGCDPEADGSVGKDCGVFVSTEVVEGAVGTKEKPFSSINDAIALAVSSNKRRVYVCVGDFAEAVSVPKDVTIFGGLDCKEEGEKWPLARMEKTVLTTPSAASPGTVPLTISAAGGSVEIKDFHVKAPAIEVDTEDPFNPENADKYGKSSVAAIADGGSVSFVRCILEAHDAAPGAPEKADESLARQGGEGSAGKAACTDSFVTPNPPPENDCSTIEHPNHTSVGGPGGNGSSARGDAGSAGSPGDTTNLNGGTRTGDQCGHGKAGRPGDMGDQGDPGSGIGTITSAGYTGVPGGNGKPGTPGQGGGGGAGARGGDSACPTGSMGKGGASGGSGGAGGCGGLGGKGGGPGGSSIALISINATLSFQEVRLSAEAGGAGASGAPGQRGGRGGQPGLGGVGGITAFSKGCDGGQGGEGGEGGPGGKGSDGHSLGIAYLGAPPPEEAEGVVTIDVGAATGNGVAEKTLDFTAP
ncbi:hypothetical protein [Sorangium sp. So ce542]|uniref:hypothetical protein n=1 Tax=Sorangium sp. So ce542 TaxID=3133316 RepID=UPI003F62A962